jgi:hypothetical protein
MYICMYVVRTSASYVRYVSMYFLLLTVPSATSAIFHNKSRPSHVTITSHNASRYLLICNSMDWSQFIFTLLLIIFYNYAYIYKLLAFSHFWVVMVQLSSYFACNVNALTWIVNENRDFIRYLISVISTATAVFSTLFKCQIFTRMQKHLLTSRSDFLRKKSTPTFLVLWSHISTVRKKLTF